MITRYFEDNPPSFSALEQWVDISKVTIDIKGNVKGDGFDTNLKDCTIYLHPPDKWREVLPLEEANIDTRDYIRQWQSETLFGNVIRENWKARPQWVNDLLLKHNISLWKEGEQPKNVILI